MNTRLISAAVLALSFITPSAVMAAAPEGQKTEQAMFAFADQNKDGQLTRAEAKGHLPFTSANFDVIDTAKRGWISAEQFTAFTDKRGAMQADQALKVGAGH